MILSSKPKYYPSKRWIIYIIKMFVNLSSQKNNIHTLKGGV